LIVSSMYTVVSCCHSMRSLLKNSPMYISRLASLALMDWSHMHQLWGAMPLISDSVELRPVPSQSPSLRPLPPLPQKPFPRAWTSRLTSCAACASLSLTTHSHPCNLVPLPLPPAPSSSTPQGVDFTTDKRST
jgi:hypothetical protein